MDLQFDGGTTTPLATLLAQGYVSLLEPLLYDQGDAETGRGPYLRSVVQVPCEPTEEYLSEHGLELLGTLPCVAIEVGDADATETQPTWLRWVFEVRLHVFCGYANTWISGRMDPDQDGDARRDPGIRAVWQHAVEAVHYRTVDTLVPETGAIKVQQVRHRMSAARMTWWTIDTRVELQQFVTLPDTRTAEDVSEIVANHDIDEGGNIVEQRRLFSG